MRGLGLGLGLQITGRPPVPEPQLVWSDDSVIDGWTTGNVTLAGAGENDPESGIEAVSMLETTANGTHRIFRTLAFTQGVTYRLRVVVKAVDRPAITFNVADTPAKYWYGNVGGAVALLASGLSNPQVADVGGGFYAHSVDLTFQAATGSVGVFLGISLNPAATSYVGEVTKGLVFGSVKLFEVV